MADTFFRRGLSHALRFDGSSESAVAIAKRFPRVVARSLEHDDVLVVVGPYGFVKARAGDWIVQDYLHQAMSVWSDAQFQLAYEAFSFSQTSES